MLPSHLRTSLSLFHLLLVPSFLPTLKSPQGESPQLRPVTPSQPHSSSVLTASRPFHLDLPVIYPEHEDLIMDNARQAAATGFIRPESIPLLAITDESFYLGKLSWTLRFPVPAPDPSGSARRFSSTVTFQQGPHSAEALEGALRLASPFSYGNEASHVLFNCPFLRLPDLSTLRPGPRIESYETPTPPEAAVIDWLIIAHLVSSPPGIVHKSQSLLGLLIISTPTFTFLRWPMLIGSHQCHNEAATAEARKHKRNYSPTDFLRVIPADTVMSGNLLPHPSQVLHLRTYHVPPLPPLNLISTHDLLKHPPSHNLPPHHTWRQPDHNTFPLQAHVLTRNDLAYPGTDSAPQLATLAPCPLLSTAPDLWDLLPLPPTAPTVALTPKEKMQLLG